MPAPAAPPESPKSRRGSVWALGAVVVCAAAVIAIVGLPGGGNGQGGALTPFAQAAATLEQQRSVRVDFRATIDSSATAQRLSMAGSGVFALSDGNGRATFTFSGLGGASPAGAALNGSQMIEIFDDPSIYISSPLFAGQLPDGARWVKIDLQRAGEASGIDFEAEQEAQQGNAANVLPYLRAAGADVQKLGRARVGDVRTTHYRADLDPQRYADVLRSEGEDEAADSIEKTIGLGAQTSPVDVWLDRGQLVRRMAFSLSLPAPTGGVSQMSMVMDFSDFGAEVATSPPPESEVFDATDLAAQGLQASGG